MAITLPSIKRGDTLYEDWNITITQGTPPVPIDLTNYVIRAMFRVSNVAPPAITLLMPDPLLTPEEVELEEANGIFRVIELTEPLLGKFKINKFKVNPIGFNVKPDFTDYKFDIEFSKDEIVQTWVSGTWRVETDITR